MRKTWSVAAPSSKEFFLPHEVFQLGLKAGELLVYIYLHYQKGVRSGQCWPSYATIGAAEGMSRKTVQRHVCALADKELVATENTSVFGHGLKVNGNLRYTLKLIRQVMKDREDEILTELKLAEAQRKWNQRHGIDNAKSEKSTTQFVTPFLKRFCYYNLAQNILVLSVIHK